MAKLIHKRSEDGALERSGLIAYAESVEGDDVIAIMVDAPSRLSLVKVYMECVVSEELDVETRIRVRNPEEFGLPDEYQFQGRVHGKVDCGILLAADLSVTTSEGVPVSVKSVEIVFGKTGVGLASVELSCQPGDEFLAEIADSVGS